MLPLPKTGDLSQISNDRGISLSSQVANTINKMILHKIMSKIDIHLRHNKMDLDRDGLPQLIY